jgi:hypothetical protein
MPATRVPAREGDIFLVALSAMMRRSGQGEHVSASILELACVPDLALICPALIRLMQRHPILAARLRRDWRTWLPWWDVPEPAPGLALPLGLWCERGSPGALGSEAREVEDAAAQLQAVRNAPLPDGFHARLDLVERRDGSCFAALSWAHLLIDGKGAELLLVEFARLCEGVESSPEVEDSSVPADWRELVQQTKPAVRHLEALAKMRIRSLSGPQPRAGRSAQQLITLEAADVARLRVRTEQHTGALFPLAFQVACAARAHDRVLTQRGQPPDGYVVSVPIQTRKRGARGPLFHNHVTVLFFGARREQLTTLESAAAAMKRQFTEMMRARLDESFRAILALMLRLPARLFMMIVRWQWRGEMCSFFQSHTGPFAPELTEFAGARVTNAYHLPGISTPPGTGIFFSEHGERLNIAFSWREGVLSDAERRLLLDHLLDDLLGESRDARV